MCVVFQEFKNGFKTQTSGLKIFQNQQSYDLSKQIC
jgi:hypothetical protein